MNSIDSKPLLVIKISLSIIFVFALIITLMVFSSCTGSRKIYGDYQTGILKSEDVSYDYYDSENMISVKVANNDTTLFIHLKFYKPSVQFQLVTSGMKLSIDTAGKNQGGYKVIYPTGRKSRMGAPNHPVAPPGSMVKKGSTISQKPDLLMAMGPSMVLLGFDEMEEKECILRNCGLFRIDTHIDSNNFLFYHLQIPFSKAHAFRRAIEFNDSTRVFYLSIDIEGVNNTLPHQGPPPGEGGRGMRPSSGPPSGEGQHQHPGADQSANNISFRIPFSVKTN